MSEFGSPSIFDAAPACHVVGGGIAGLAAALAMAEAGVRVHLYEAATHLGGRCRSLPDQKFGTAIDNGSHLLFSANRAAIGFLRRIGAPSTAIFAAEGLPFYDLGDDARWRIAPRGESALWMLGGGLRIPGVSRWRLFAEGWKLSSAPPGSRVGDVIPGKGAAWRRFWTPFLKAAFNADPATVSAPHAAAVLKTLARNGRASGQPLLASRPWSEVIAEPAAARLRYHGATIHLGMPLLALDRGEEKVRRLIFRRGTIDTARDAVILALPNAAAHRLCPDICPEIPFSPILNLHFETGGNLGLGVCGLVGGVADWVFWRGPVVSITLSGPEAQARPLEALAHAAWAEAATVLPRPFPLLPPPFRRIVEKRAAVAATPEAFAARPGTETPQPNLFLAGDWTATGLPSTIEGAVLSGDRAAEAAIASLRAGIR
jgi:squalene-associated FAD-dependent desaturase